MIKFIFFPFSALWSLFMYIRRNFYDKGRRINYNKPTICVGNLCMGGSGKTPHIGYLVDLLQKNNIKTAILSRGYKRKTKGFRFVDALSSSQDVGDEPLLLYKKYEPISVAVCKNRIEGLNKIFEQQPETDIVLLDDAYQYMPLRPGLSILLTDYYHSYMQDFVVPSGGLREGQSAAKDADIIIVTKSPATVPALEEAMILDKIKPLPHQEVYFSHIEFGKLIPITQKAETMSLDNVNSIVAVCGIANPYPFLDYVNKNFSEKQTLIFPDHHRFTNRDIQKIQAYCNRSMRKNCAIVTTEKDAMRLLDSEFKNQVEQLPIFYIPIEVKFNYKYKEKFEKRIYHYVNENTGNS